MATLEPVSTTELRLSMGDSPTPPTTPPTPPPPKSITFSSTGGTLHGLWVADNYVATSDRAMKTGIANLEEYAAGQHVDCHSANRDPRKPCRSRTRCGNKPCSGRALAPMLRELRPVVYHYKNVESKTAHTKQVRFGFIADELEDIVPEVVREIETAGETKKGVVYQDLIALLAAGIREQQGRLDALEKQQTPTVDEKKVQRSEVAMHDQLQNLVKKLSAEVQDMKAKVAKSESHVLELLKGMEDADAKKIPRGTSQRGADPDEDKKLEDAKKEMELEEKRIKEKMEVIEKREGESGTKELEHRLLRQELAIATIQRNLLESGCRMPK